MAEPSWASLNFLIQLESVHQLSNEGRGGTKQQMIAMKFGMLVIGLGENAMSNDELAQRRHVD